jgi:hypothetical protein
MSSELLQTSAAPASVTERTAHDYVQLLSGAVGAKSEEDRAAIKSLGGVPAGPRRRG